MKKIRFLLVPQIWRKLEDKAGLKFGGKILAMAVSHYKHCKYDNI